MTSCSWPSGLPPSSPDGQFGRGEGVGLIYLEDPGVEVHPPPTDLLRVSAHPVFVCVLRLLSLELCFFLCKTEPDSKRRAEDAGRDPCAQLPVHSGPSVCGSCSCSGPRPGHALTQPPVPLQESLTLPHILRDQVTVAALQQPWAPGAQLLPSGCEGGHGQVLEGVCWV